MSRYRLSLDIGSNSIGWCALNLEGPGDRPSPVSILGMGVRIFPDGRNPKDGSSNAVARRMARGMRRNRDRYLDRRNRLMQILVESGLMPQDESQRRALVQLDPYLLRSRGLDHRLELFEFGRALFHLNQRRGFKSNRKQDSADKETGAIKTAISDQREQMAACGARTFGEYLFMRREKGELVRSRLKTRQVKDDKGKEKKLDYYDFYPSREELASEFDTLWAKQSVLHGTTLSEEVRDRVRDVIFYQRPLKKPLIGRCTFEPGEERASKALPMVQRIRIYQELNHLQIIDNRTLDSRFLTLSERDALAGMLCQPAGIKKGRSEVSFDKMRKRLDLDSRMQFSLESDKRKGLDGDTMSALLAHKDRFGQRWFGLSDADQERILDNLLDISDEEELIQSLMADFGFDRDHAQAIATTPIPDQYSRLGVTATRKILAELVREVIPYSEAVVRAGYKSHSQLSSGAMLDRLPYYGEVLERHVLPDPEKAGHPAAKLEQRYGKVTNPTVHIALNQLRKVVNEIIKLHGKPEEIHVEVLRELKNSLAKRQDIEKEQTRNKTENDECRRQLQEVFGIKVNRDNIQRLRLWRELSPADRFCVYSGEIISDQVLFTPAVEIDHILPFARTLDDSMANKILCMRHANREKTNQTPYEKWGETDRWPAILDRSGALPGNKRWRFAENAMERYQKEGDFLARQLTDSQYIARLAREYLAVLFSPDKPHKVVCLPGRLTGLFRHHLGLDSILDELDPDHEGPGSPRKRKNRDDHRNHTVDALVVGLMDRAFLQRAATVSARLEQEGVTRLLKDFDEPWPEFRAEVRDALSKIIVSHKPDHGIEGPLHNDTAYGYARREDVRGNAVHRVSVQQMDVNDIPKIRGRRLRAELVAFLSKKRHDEAFALMAEFDDAPAKLKSELTSLCDPLSRGSKDIQVRMQAFFADRGIRHVKIIETITLVDIKDRQGKVYKGFKPDGNAYMEIIQPEDSGQWEHRIVTSFEANNPNPEKNASSGAAISKITRLFNRDMLELEHGGERRIFYIQKMSANQLALAEHFEANADSRTRDPDDPYRFVYKGSAEALRKAKARFLTVTPAGRVRYLSDAHDDTPGA